MNKIAKYLIVPMLCLATNFASAANIKDYPRIAVMDFGNKAIASRGLRGHDMAMATEYAIYQLSSSGWFDLIDYEQLNSIAQMHRINMSGLIDQGTAVQMGKIAGAQFMVIGNVTGLTTKENIAGIRAHTATANNAQHVVNANVTMRIVDIETGRIVAAGIGKGSSTSTMTEFGFTKYRNRKVETENIYNRTSSGKSDNYVKNSSSAYTNENGYENIDKKVRDNISDSKNMSISREDLETAKELDEFIDKSTYNSYQYNYGREQASAGSSHSHSNYKNKYYKLGDVNGDNSIDEKDLELLSAYLVELPINGVFIKVNADVNQDNKISITDLSRLKLYLNGKIILPTVTQTSPISSENITTQYYHKGEYDKGSGNVESGSTSARKDLEKENYRKTDIDYHEDSNYRRDLSENARYESVNNYKSGYEDEHFENNNYINTDKISNKNIHYERESMNYSVVIGTVEVSDVQVRNAISKAVRDAIYGNTGIMTVLNGGKKLKIKTGF